MVAVELCLHRVLVTMCIKFGSGYTASLNQTQFSSSVTASVIVTMRPQWQDKTVLPACKQPARMQPATVTAYRFVVVQVLGIQTLLLR